MVIWQGWGILALLIPMACSVGANTVFDAIYGENFYTTSRWAMPMALFLAAGLVYLAGNKLNNKPGRILLDPENNQKVELKNIHSMFWIPLQYWSGIVIVFAVWICFSH